MPYSNTCGFRLKRALLAAFVVSVPADAARAASDAEAIWLDRLDAWVAASGPQSAIQDAVISNCGKLLIFDAGASEAARMTATTAGRSDLDMQVDVCAKLTINRVYPQPEFDKPEIRKVVCGDLAAAHPAIFKLCQRAKVQP